MTWLPDPVVRRLQMVANWPEFESDRYTVFDELGRGGMGTVYLAHDEVLAREVAIKVSNAVATTTIAERLHTEARILARLEHHGIVPIHDVGRLADGRLFYVMKRIRGETLDEHLRKPLDLSARLGLFERICEPVAFAHAHEIVHRDLKPENVMVGPFGEVMVLDWGIAKAFEDPSRADGRIAPGTVLGTLGYMSPELARGAADDVDGRADVYSLGAILHTILVGQPPAPGDAGLPLLQSRHHRVSRPLRSICARALAADPAARYPTVQALAADIARYRAGRAVEAHRETPVEQIVRLTATYRTPILLILAYILMRTIVALTAGW